MKEKTEEFEIGKRHLAKMMGENPETFSQDKIDVISHLKHFFLLKINTNQI